jgi:HK97 family phage major capsid protein
MSKYLTPAHRETLAVLVEADEISKRADITKQGEARLSFLLAKLKTLMSGVGGVTSNECDRYFRHLFRGQDHEIRASMEAGTQTLAYTQGTEGGYTVPQEFHDSVVAGMAQFDPLLNADIVTLIPSGDASLKPYNVPGWDLSTFAAVKEAEIVQQTAQTPPTVTGTLLNGYKYKASLSVSIELEEDSFKDMQTLMAYAYGIGFARGIGVDLVLGNGTTAPQGVLTGAANSGYTTANSGKIVNTDVTSIFFSVNAFYRNSPKCAWLMNDTIYEQFRNATDNQGRPLLTFEVDKMICMGKPVYICPSLLGASHNGIVFGDLSHMFVRTSKLTIQPKRQLPGYVENGLCLYTGYMRSDAKVIDPTNGGTPPIIYAAVHS